MVIIFDIFGYLFYHIFLLFESFMLCYLIIEA